MTICRIFCILLLAGCSQYEPPYYIRLVHHIIREHAISSNEKTGMRLVGRGGALMHNVKQVNVHYELCKEIEEIEEVRKIYINSTEDLLSKINNNKEIREYLNQYPFTEFNIDFTLSLIDEYNNIAHENYFSLIYVSKGIIYYQKYDHIKEDYIFIHKESYTEAKKTVSAHSPY